MKKWIFLLATLAILAGLGLSIASALEMCSEECAEGHNWLLYGLRFEVIGIPYFLILLATHLLSKEKITAFLLYSGLGAEAVFIYLQKFVIGHWCPICLSIAACIFVASCCYYYTSQKGAPLMSKFIPLAVMVFGLTAAFLGVSKDDKLGAVENNIKGQIILGNKSSPVSVYVFTDWACPACRQLEPTLESLTPSILKVAKLTFVDYVIHPETLNYSPYNLYFLSNNKSEYLKIREALTHLSEKTGDPNDDQVKDAIKHLNVKYGELGFAEVTMAQKYFEDLGNTYKVDGTPTLVVVNDKTKKSEKLEGSKITQEKVLKAIEDVK